MKNRNEPGLLPSLDILAKLYSAVVADSLDSLGYRKQTLSTNVRPLTSARKVVGRVFPAKAARVRTIPKAPYKLEIAAVEEMSGGDVFVVDAGDDTSCGFWGELLTTACSYKGIRGVVMTACSRDIWKIESLGFPVFGIGYHPADSKGRTDIIELGKPIVVSGVAARRGDLIIGDEDGIVVIPSEVANEVLRLASEKASGENIVRRELSMGMPMGTAFRKYGIL